MTAQKNRQLLLKSRPEGMIDESNFEVVESPVPVIGDGELLVKVHYVSIDPGMRGWLRPHRTYVDPVPLGDVMRALSLGQVIESRRAGFEAGEFVVGWLGIQDYAVTRGEGLHKANPALAPLPAWLNALGMPGLTAYFGLLKIGAARPGDTVLISAAAGAVGSLVGQIGQLMDCRTIGLAGSAEKCAWLTDELGFDAAINYRESKDLAADIKGAAPDGVDIYYDNVGGEILDAALMTLNQGARVVVCGMISQYNNTGPGYGVRNTLSLLRNRARMEGFIVFDFKDQFHEAYPRLGRWVRAGKLHHREDLTRGIENAAAAMKRMFTGENFGKSVLEISPPAL
ncbi:MAG: NADP-dependent oxidoreductase [Alphaproteobacteria bacterium]